MKNRRDLGQLTWNSDGFDFCFLNNDEFLSLDDGEGVQRFSMKSGLPTVVWQSHGEALNVIVRTGPDRYLVGGSFGIAYDLKVDRDGVWQLQGQRHVLQYFDCAAFAQSEQLIAVCWYHKLIILPLEEDDPRKPVEVVLDKKRIFSVEWVPAEKRFLVVSPMGLFLVGLDGRVKQIPTPAGEVLAATRILDSGEFACATGSGDQVTVFAAPFSNPKKHNWNVSFTQPPFRGQVFGPESTMQSACLLHSSVNKELVLSCCASVRRIDNKGIIQQEVQLPNAAPKIALSPDEAHVVVGTRLAGLFVLDRKGQLVRPRTCHGLRVGRMLFSDDESQLFTSSVEVLCWDVKTGTRNWEFWVAFKRIFALVHAEDGRLLFCRDGASKHGSVLSELNGDGEERTLFSFDGFSVRAIRLDPTRVLMACRQFGKPAKCELLDFPNGRTIFSVALGENDPDFLTSDGSIACIHDRYHIWVVDLSRKGEALDLPRPTEDRDLGIFMESDSSIVVVSKTGVFRSSLKVPRWNKLADFKIPATASGAVSSGKIPIAFENGTVEIRNVADWSTSQTETGIFENTSITACTLSPSGRLLAVGAKDGRIMLCEVD